MVDIYKELDKLRKQGKDAVIVTVTEKSGMGPADVGKKMLVTEGNVAFGTVGGGAIEYYAREKCKEVLDNRMSFSEKYVLNDRTVSVDDGSIILPMACGRYSYDGYEGILDEEDSHPSSSRAYPSHALDAHRDACDAECEKQTDRVSQ